MKAIRIARMLAIKVIDREAPAAAASTMLLSFPLSSFRFEVSSNFDFSVSG